MSAEAEAEAPILRMGIFGIFMFILPCLNIVLRIEEIGRNW
jgi:hypothetical protein